MLTTVRLTDGRTEFVTDMRDCLNVLRDLEPELYQVMDYEYELLQDNLDIANSEMNDSEQETSRYVGYLDQSLEELTDVLLELSSTKQSKIDKEYLIKRLVEIQLMLQV